jgi:chromosome segregation ATPase
VEEVKCENQCTSKKNKVCDAESNKCVNKDSPCREPGIECGSYSGKDCGPCEAKNEKCNTLNKCVTNCKVEKKKVEKYENRVDLQTELVRESKNSLIKVKQDLRLINGKIEMLKSKIYTLKRWIERVKYWINKLAEIIKLLLQYGSYYPPDLQTGKDINQVQEKLDQKEQKLTNLTQNKRGYVSDLERAKEKKKGILTEVKIIKANLAQRRNKLESYKNKFSEAKKEYQECKSKE